MRCSSRLGQNPVNWYAEPQYWYAILMFLSIWKGLGYFTIIYLAGMLNINPEYYEAARIDGATKLQEALIHQPAADSAH